MRVSQFFKSAFIQRYGLLILILMIAVFLRLYNLTYGLPLLLYEDEPIYLYRCLPFGHGAFDPDYFKKPSFFLYFYFLFYYLYYLVGALFGSFHSWSHFVGEFWKNPSALAIIGRIISIGFSLASIGVLYRIGLRFSRWVAFAAALLLTLDQTHLFYTPRVVSDIPSLCCLLLVAFFALEIYQKGRLKDYLLTGVFLGLTYSFKYNVFSTLFLLTAHVFSSFKRDADLSYRERLKQIIFSKPLWFALLTAFGLFALLNPFVVLNYSRFIEHMAFEKKHMLLRDPNAAQSQWHFMISFADLCGKIIPKAIGWPMYVMSIISGFGLFISAIYQFVKKRNDSNQDKNTAFDHLSKISILTVFPIAFLILLMQFKFLNAKYLLPLLPFAYLSVACGLEKFSQFVLGTFSKLKIQATRLKPVLMLLLLLVLAFPMLAKSSTLLLRYHHPDTRLLVRQYIEQVIKPGDLIYVDEESAPLNQWNILERQALVLERHQHAFQMVQFGRGEAFYQSVIHAPKLGQSDNLPNYILLQIPLNHEGHLKLAQYLDELSPNYRIQRIFSPFKTRLNQNHIIQQLNADNFDNLIHSPKKAITPGPLLILMKSQYHFHD